MIIWNAGQLPPDWSLARLMAKHPSQPANPDIARVLFLAGKIESWGRGIDLIRNACLDYGSPAPLFDCDSGGFWLEFAFAALIETGKTSVETSVETSVKTSVALLELLRKNPAMTLAEVAAEIGLSVRAVEMSSAKLVKAGKLRHIGPQKGGQWEVIS